MDSRISLRCAALIGLTALVVGCEQDTSDRQGAVRDGSAQSRPGDSAVARNDSREAPAAANRDSTVRPPTTATNPAAPGSAAAPTTPRLMARAEIQPLGDHTARGIVEFEQAPPGSSGPMTIHVMLMGLDAGPHGMHVHMGTDCMAPGSHLNPQDAPHGPANAASGMRHLGEVHVHMGTDCMAPGSHLNPQDAPHGPANAASGMRHLGDLGNITADASGMVEEMLRDSLLGSDASFIGRVVIVHEGQDDLSTQPDGSSGQPVGCGLIEPAGEDVISRGPAPDRGV